MLLGHMYGKGMQQRFTGFLDSCVPPLLRESYIAPSFNIRGSLIFVRTDVQGGTAPASAIVCISTLLPQGIIEILPLLLLRLLPHVATALQYLYHKGPKGIGKL